MIELVGEDGSNEYRAAQHLVKAISALWPGVESSPIEKDNIIIASNVKISGYKVADIDIVMCGVFHRERKFIPRKVLHDTTGKRVVGKPISVKNFLVTIEVKDHNESGVIINGDNVNVKYSRGHSQGWKSATDQNIDQVHSFLDYLNDLNLSAYVHRCLIMQGLGDISVNGTVPMGHDGTDFFTSLASVSRVSNVNNGFQLSSGSNQEISRILGIPIFKKIIPTALDRKRMDMIVNGTEELGKIQSLVGQKMIRLRGHGGTGKTVMCLQMAWKAFQEKGQRTLVLTYNHALAADIRRLTALLNVPSNPEEGGIAVGSVMSFMYTWFRKLNVIEDEEDASFENYESNCRVALEYLSTGAISGDDIDGIIKNNTDRYDFDCIVVDEAQDWPQGEADLLKALYKPETILLADGIDQLTRGKRTDWDKGIDPSSIEVIPLNQCLRMKSNLSVFANQIAEKGGLKWEVSPNTKAGGGKIIIANGSYDSLQEVHEAILTDAKGKGNDEVDFLFCVPYQDVHEVDGKRRSHIGDYLSQAGYDIWDGVDQLTRKDFPRSKSQFRIVQYASCRGLEGWTVVLEKADLYWEECKFNRTNDGLTAGDEIAFEDLESISKKYAWQKIMIPFTRAIDTLVITVDNESNEFAMSLIEIASRNLEFVEIIRHD